MTSGEVLDRARLYVALSRDDLYWRYFALGGSARRSSVEKLLDGHSDEWKPAEVNILVQAVNERYAEIGMKALVAYVKH